MMTDRQIERMLSKLVRLEETLGQLLFVPVDEISMEAFHTQEQYHEIPLKENFKPCEKGSLFQGEGSYCWFRGSYTVPERLAGKTLFIYPKIEGYEGLLWVNGKPYGNFTNKISRGGHGNHYCDMLKLDVTAKENIEIAIEYYAHHFVIGTQPFENNTEEKFEIIYNGAQICVKNEEIWDVYFNLYIANQMAAYLEDNSFRRADIINTLKKVHEIVYYDYDNCDKEEFIGALKAANVLLKEILEDKNAASAPYAGLIGHSHMDTAWLWNKKETLKKCARTYANQISLMDQYPDYKFIQSSAYHSAIIKDHYPELFEEIRKKVAEGKYEPNGGVWVECDCNIPSGESIIRQFLWGQRFTRENFNYTSDCFWLPDTFGYSAALPQIMQGCGVKYFLTTKISWCDTTEFPYDTFYWKGIDGSKVFVHFNRTHTWPDPKNLMESIVNGGHSSLHEKNVNDKRLIAYGLGDGGGGPEFEMIEIAERIPDVDGIPSTGHTSVSNFMHQLEETSVDPSVYQGELYLELHRGTLTNQHTIKRNNRMAEIALRNLEYLTVRDAVKKGDIASDEKIRPLMYDLLVNQFHDILPGTCIPSAHDESYAEMDRVLTGAKQCTREILATDGEKDTYTVLNTLSFERNDPVYLNYVEGYIVKGDYKQQVITDLNGEKKLVVLGVSVPAFSGITLTMVPGKIPEESAFEYEKDTLKTPYITVSFDQKGYMSSFIDREAERELKGEGYAFNTFLVAEEVSSEYDNWDLDSDAMCRFKDCAKLISREIVANGAVEFRIRSEYQLTHKSSLKQDMIFYSDRKEVVFETVMNWQDNHHFLKTAFDTTIFTDVARQEVQFGYIKRPTTRNTAHEKAKFEVSNHKYTDLSETRYGAALLNDCKYGISVKDSSMWLSLHKGGCRPDYRGDKGVHYCSYAFYPHAEGFGANSVIKPSYMFNMKPVITTGRWQNDGLLSVDADNIIVETIKPAEDNERAFIVRMYEAEGTRTKAKLTFVPEIKKLALTNMLEEVIEELPLHKDSVLTFGAFEIKTMKVSY